jgi:hypothetical protein
MALRPEVYTTCFYGVARSARSSMRTWKQHLADPASFEVLISDLPLLMRELRAGYDWEGFLQSYEVMPEYCGETIYCYSLVEVLLVGTKDATEVYYQAASTNKRAYFTHK